MPENRGVTGRFLPGGPSRNPGARPLGLAALVQAETRDGALPRRVFIPHEVAVQADGVLDIERAIRPFLDEVIERGYSWRLEEDVPRWGWMLTLTPPGEVRPRLRGGDGAASVPGGAGG